jgi:hypothetical protein
MANTVIRLKKSSISGRSPNTLEHGELAINYTDGKLFYKDDANVIQRISGGANSFMYMNVNGTMLVAGVLADVLTINAGNNIEINTDVLTNKYTITANLQPSFRVANAAFALANNLNNVALVVSNTAPSNPVQGKLWWHNTIGTLFVYYVDEDGTASWVEAVPNGGGVTDGGGGGSTDLTPVFTKTNAAYTVANAAFAKANSANVLAYNTGIGANAYSNSLLVTARAYTNTSTTAANNYAGVMANSANGYANNTFIKSTATTQIITGSLEITGNLILSGNATSISTDNLSVQDPLIFLAANNISDIVDIGLVGHYSNGSANVHTGIYRDHASKEYFLFNELSGEPQLLNDIVPYANNMVNAVLNSDVRTSNLNLGGANAIVWIRTAFDTVNAAYTSSNADYTLTNAAFVVANAAYGQANTKLSNGTVTLAGALTTTGQIFANSQITIYPTSGGDEGGEIQLWGAGSYPDWSIDSYQNQLRFFTGNSGTQQVNFFNAVGGSLRMGINTASPSYAVDVTGDVNVTGAFRVNGTPLSTGTVDLTAANNWANTVGVYANNYAGAMSNSVNAYTSATYSTLTQLGQNWAVTNAAFGVANTALQNTSGVSFNGNLNFPTGNVGIGTTAPGYKLDVVGSVNASALLVNGAAVVAPGTATTFTATQTFNGTSSTLASVLTNAAEVTTVSATAATGTIAYDITTQSVLYYTSDASANWTVNFRGSSGTSLNTLLSNNQTVTVVFMVTQGATAYYNNAVQIDGVSVTPKWQGGTAPTAGNASSVDVYTYTITKTASATFTVLASLTQFK